MTAARAPIYTKPARMQVVIALRQGLGVDDMHARRIVSADTARAVIADLRAEGRLAAVCGWRARQGRAS